MKNKYRISSIVLILCIFCSCLQTRQQGKVDNIRVKLSDISQNSEKYLDKQVELEGAFLGWSGSGCSYMPGYVHQIMRSDWTFRDNDGLCIFVTGGKPEFLDPLNNEDIGRKILLIAKVKADKEKKIYLEFVSAAETK